jgi:predicted ATPase
MKVMATSRVPLKLSGEHEYPVQPLPAADAAALFSARAVALDPSFDVDAAAGAVDEICARLDGLPLAIELAAARIKLLPPQALLERLGRGPGFLRGRGDELPVRQRTLRDTIDWSYRLLDDEERALSGSSPCSQAAGASRLQKRCAPRTTLSSSTSRRCSRTASSGVIAGTTTRLDSRCSPPFATMHASGWSMAVRSRRPSSVTPSGSSPSRSPRTTG